MIDNHGTTHINSDGSLELNGLIASNFESQDVAILTHLQWVLGQLENEIEKLKSKILLSDSYARAAI